MMFMIDFTVAVELIALGIGAAFLVWAYRNNGKGIGTAKVFGYIITIVAALVLICTIYYGIAYSTKGCFKSSGMHKAMMMKQCHRGMMQHKPMMQRKSMPAKPYQSQQ